MKLTRILIAASIVLNLISPAYAFVDTGNNIIYTPSSNNVGIGKIAPGAKLDVNGTAAVAKLLSAGVVNGTVGNFTTVNATNISAGTVNASTLGGLSASQFLRSDASTTYSSGTLTVNSGTTVDINSTAVSIADTDITLDGASTTFTQSSGAITMTPANGSNMNVNLLGLSDFKVDTTKFVVDNNGNVGIGTAAPSQMLDVTNSQNGATMMRVSNTNTAGSAYTALLLNTSTNTNSALYLFGTHYGGTGAYTANATVLSSGVPAGPLNLATSQASSPIKFYTAGVASSNQRLSIESAGNVAIGPMAANQLLTVNGAVSIKETSAPSGTSTFGKLYANSTNSKLYFLDDSGVAYNLLNGATAASTDATTLDTIDSTSFLRSDTSDSFTSGTITFDAGTSVDINSTTVSIADTDITLDGASTTFTQSSGAITMTPANGSNMNVNLLGLSDFKVDTTKFVVDNNGNVGIGTTATNGGMLKVVGQGATNLFSAYQGSVLRTFINPRGIQEWNLNSGASEVGKIAYSTPGGFPGIIIYNGNLANRFNIMNVGTGFTFGYNDVGDGTALQIYRNHNVGIGSMVPNQLLTVNGAVAIKETSAPSNTSTFGKLYANSTNSKLYFLDDSGVAYNLLNGSALGALGGADTQFQFNDAGSIGGNGALTFTKASKTLTIPSDAPLDINSTTVSIADTDITLDGASTTFTQTTGAITLVPAAATNVNVTGTLVASAQVNGATANFTTANFTTGNITNVAATKVIASGSVNGATANFTTGNITNIAATKVIASGSVNGATANFTTGNITNIAATKMIASGSVNGSTANFTAGNITTVNSTTVNTTTVNATTVNGASLDGNFANGSILFSNADGVISEDNAQVYWDRENSRLSIGKLSPEALLDLNGTIMIRGGSPGVDKFLTSDANGLASWIAIPSVSNASTLDGLDSTSFLRSDTSDSFTSGTITFDSGTSVDINSTTLSIADTNVTLDGASTTFTQTTGAITLVPAAATNVNVTGTLVASAQVNGATANFTTANFTTGNITNIAATKMIASGSVNGATANFTTGNITNVAATKVIASGSVNGATANFTTGNITNIAATKMIASGSVNGSTANFTAGNITTVNSTTVNTTAVNATTVNGASLDGNFTNGSILFSNADGVISEDNAQVYWDRENSRLSIGKLAPEALLDLNGTIMIRGGSPGADKFLTSDANGLASWIAIPSVSNASTLDGLDSTSFLRSDASDSFTSGTITFDAGTTVDINSTTLSIADTNVTLDGASTTFTQTTGAITLVPAAATNVNVTGTLVASAQVNGATANFTTANFTTGNITNIAATKVIASGSVNGATANFTAGNIATVNSTTVNATTVNGASLDGNFTNGSILFSNPSGVISQANANLFWDRINRRLAIDRPTAAAKLDINGTIMIRGGSPGASKFLTSDANGLASWITIPSVSNASTLDGLDSTSFLRSDTSDSFTSGTITFDAGTSVDINSTTVSIADTDITLDGASTTFTQSTGAITMLPANGSNMNVNLLGVSDFKVDTTKFVVDNNGNVGIGTAAPSQMLDVVNSQNGATMMRVSNTSTAGSAYTALLLNTSSNTNSALYLFGTHYGGTGAYTANATVLTSGVPAGALNLATSQASSPIKFYTAGVASSNQRLSIESGGNVAIGPMAANQLLTVNGVVSIKETSAPSLTSTFGKLYANSTNSKLYFLDDSGVSYNLLNGSTSSSAAAAGSNTYFQFNDSSALGGNGALTFTKGTKTLAVASDAPLDINSTTVSIADTDITLDGASTTFTQSSGAITLTPANGSNLNVNLRGLSDFVVDTSKLVVNNNGQVGIGSAIALGNDGFANAATLTIVSPAITSGRERPMYFKVSDSSNYVSVINTTAVDSRFVPTVVGYAPDSPSTVQAMSFDGRIAPASDSGTTPIITFRVQQLNGTTAITTRPIAGFGSGPDGNDYRMIIGSTGNVGIGTLSPNQLLSVNGSVSIRETSAPSSTSTYGKLYANSTNSKLYFLDDSGVSYNLLNGSTSSSAAAAGSNTYFQFNDSSALGGNGALTFTKGTKTLAVASDAPLDINSTTVSIADTDITLDGASTTFTQSSGAITITPANGSNLNVNLRGLSDFAVDTSKLVVDNNGFVGLGTAVPLAHLSIVDEAATASRGVQIYQNSSDAAAATMGFRKSRGTYASPTIINNADYLAAFNASAYNGSAYSPFGNFGYRVNGPVTASSIPGEWFFAASTSPDNSPYVNSTVRMLIKSSGNVGIGTLTPSQKFHVAGGWHAADNTYGLSIKDTGGTDRSIISVNAVDEANFINNSGGNGGPLVFASKSGGVESMRLTVGGNLGLGLSSANQLLTVNGAVAIKETSAPSATSTFGKLYVNSTNSKLYFIDDGGTAYNLQNGAVAASSDASTLDTVDSTSFLRSDTSDSFTSGTITFDAGTSVDINSTTVSIADTDITLDGASTTFTQSSGAITLTPANGSNLNVNLRGVSDFVVDTDKLLVNNNGSVLIGSTATYGRTASSIAPQLEVNKSANYNVVSLNTFSTGSSESSILDLAASRSATIGTQSAVGTTHGLGTISFSGSDGTGFIRGAQITAFTDSTVGTNDMPASLIFSTTTDGAASPSEKMRITNAGNVGIYDTTPDYLLDVNGTLGATTATVSKLLSSGTVNGTTGVFSGKITGAGLVSSAGVNGTRLDITEGSAVTAGSGKGTLFVNSSDSELYFDADDQTALRITNNGSLATSAGVAGSTKQVQFNNGGTLSGSANLTFNGGALKINNLAVFGSEYSVGNSSTSATINWNNGNRQYITMTGNCTFTFTAPTSGIGNFLLRIIQDGTGSRTITWPATVKWPSGTAPTLTTTAAGVDIVSCYYNGTSYYCSASMDFQ